MQPDDRALISTDILEYESSEETMDLKFDLKSTDDKLMFQINVAAAFKMRREEDSSDMPFL